MSIQNVDFSTIKHLFESDLLDEIQRVGIHKKVPKGALMIDIGESIRYIPLILDGVIKIVREDDSGGELLLYFVEFGNTCAMTLNCCLDSSKSEISALCESDVSLIMIPVNLMDLWLTRYKSWRTFIFDNFQSRLNEMLKTIDALTFLKLDDRLRNYLEGKFKHSNENKLHITHLEIANDLNSSRVVISRLLKQMENEGHIKLGRNTLSLLN
jgi:CRP/FNR family transcriptional regulator